MTPVERALDGEDGLDGFDVGEEELGDLVEEVLPVIVAEEGKSLAW